MASIAFGANVMLGAVLFALAGLVLRRSPDRDARGWLALFLALVGVNYFFEGWTRSDLLVGNVRSALERASYAANFVDPAALLAFAFAVTGVRLTRARQALVWAIPALLLIEYAWEGPASGFDWTLLPLYSIEVVVYYPLATLVLARGYLSETRSLQRDRLGTLLVGLTVIALPRPFLIFMDWRLHRTLGLPSWSSFLAAGLVVVSFAFAALLRARAQPLAREHVARTARAAQSVLLVVAGSWALIALPAVGSAAFTVAYSARWFLFVAVFAIGVRRYELLDLPDRTERWFRRGLVVVTAALGVLEIAVILGGLPGADLQTTLFVSLALVGVAVALVVALRDAAPEVSRELSWRALAAYRAHAELDTPPAELEELRLRLGLSDRAARQVRDLVAIERAAPSKVAPEISEGTTFAGRYVVQRFLGAGAFGRTFLALDEVGRERVVLKELSPTWRSDAEAVERFRREAEVALRVSHPHLVAFRGLERAGEGHVLVLQYVEGDTLKARLARGWLSPEEARTVALDVAAALDALHEKGIVHRDVKPENIVIDTRGRATLLDFGSAAVPTGGTRLAGANPGTRGYMAPEQAAGETVTPASDVYALAATIAEALGPGASPVWRELLARAMEADPRRRVATASAFAAGVPQPSYVASA